MTTKDPSIVKYALIVVVVLLLLALTWIFPWGGRSGFLAKQHSSLEMAPCISLLSETRLNTMRQLDYGSNGATDEEFTSVIASIAGTSRSCPLCGRKYVINSDKNAWINWLQRPDRVAMACIDDLPTASTSPRHHSYAVTFEGVVIEGTAAVQGAVANETMTELPAK